MANEVQLTVSFLLAFAAAVAATPLAIAVAAKTEFHDRPVGYKGHTAPTPYLGGAAVLCGFLVAALTLGGEFARLWPIVGCAFALWLLGTLDDRVNLGPAVRMAAEAIVAMILWIAGFGWDVFPGATADLALTILWVVGLVNAFNLMDNMDGAAASVAAVTAGAIGALALVQGDVALATLNFGLAGACLGFLPYNLASPARIFLGDGGSLPIGLVIAASLMIATGDGSLGIAGVLAAALLAGLPVLDTSLVSVSRRRAGVSLVTGGRDHLTHRLRNKLGTPRTVALTLALAQAGLGAISIGVIQLGEGSVIVAWSIWFVVATAAIALLETRAWAPREPVTTVGARSAPVGRGPRVRPSLVESLLIAFISISCGLSPLLYGFYDVNVWGPIALGSLAALMGILIARPAAPRLGALLAIAALAVFWLWALASTTWAESADQAMTEANRWMLYAALFAILVSLIRDDRLSVVVLGAGAAVILALGGYILGRMLAGSGSELFLGGRLHKPLGYINGEAGYLLLGMWPLIALGERTRNPLLGGAAIAGASGLLSLVVLGQTRAVIPAALVSALVLLVAVPGRTARCWALLFTLAGVALSLSPVLHVYEAAQEGVSPASLPLRAAALAIIGASAGAGSAWGLAIWISSGVSRRFPASKATGVLGWAPLVAILGVVAVVALSAVNDPVGRVRHGYRAFTQLQGDAASSSRFSSGGGNRYEYWRIAWDQFSAHPFQGVGAGNYDRTYFLERRIAEDVRQPHSIELQSLGELGIVGGSLLVLLFGAVLAGFGRRARAARADPRQGALAVAAGGTFLVWMIHTSVDWLHLIPGITGLALCSAAVLTGPWRKPRASGTGKVRLLVLVVSGIAVAIGAVLVARVALAERYREQGERLLPDQPVAALAKANDSLGLNGQAVPTYYLRAAAWARLGDYRRSRSSLLGATRLEPHDFVTWALLGDLATRRGDRAAARRYYKHAARLNPRDASIAGLASTLR